jgi:hypothetical protein
MSDATSLGHEVATKVTCTSFSTSNSTSLSRGLMVSHALAFGGHVYTEITSAGGAVITLAESCGGVVTTFAGSVYTVAASAAASAATASGYAPKLAD